jgi:hypothetical protein
MLIKFQILDNIHSTTFKYANNTILAPITHGMFIKEEPRRILEKNKTWIILI